MSQGSLCASCPMPGGHWGRGSSLLAKPPPCSLAASLGDPGTIQPVCLLSQIPLGCVECPHQRASAVFTERPQDCPYPPCAQPLSLASSPPLRLGSLLQLPSAREKNPYKGCHQPHTPDPCPAPSPCLHAPQKQSPLVWPENPKRDCAGKCPGPISTVPGVPALRGGCPEGGRGSPSASGGEQSPVPSPSWPQLWGLPAAWGGGGASRSF